MAGPGAYPEPLSDIFTPFIISLRQACPLAFGLTKHLMPTTRARRPRRRRAKFLKPGFSSPRPPLLCGPSAHPSIIQLVNNCLYC